MLANGYFIHGASIKTIIKKLHTNAVLTNSTGANR